MKIDKNKVIAILRHYAYAAFSAGLAAYLAGTTDAKAIATAAVVGVLGPILGALDPKNTKYGVGCKKTE
jgi:hypothetical protein